ncbi:MAG: UbiX family flavin prenyltransferase [Spirochaetia bacterium]|nr:UbiX family flavin prenyltransferase [Spirochaetia bacterium]
MMDKINLIIGVSGASGSIYISNLLQTLSEFVEGKSALIISDSALRVYREEINPHIRSEESFLNDILGNLPDEKRIHQFEIFSTSDTGAPPASGSANYEGMVIMPCSMKTLSAVARGHASNLMERAADVCIKERKKLILTPRETPLSLIHIQNMRDLTLAGAVILPASPGFYHKPSSMNDLANFITSKALNLLGISTRRSITWKGDHETA